MPVENAINSTKGIITMIVTLPFSTLMVLKKYFGIYTELPYTIVNND